MKLPIVYKDGVAIYGESPLWVVAARAYDAVHSSVDAAIDRDGDQGKKRGYWYEHAYEHALKHADANVKITNKRVNQDKLDVIFAEYGEENVLIEVDYYAPSQIDVAYVDKTSTRNDLLKDLIAIKLCLTVTEISTDKEPFLVEAGGEMYQNTGRTQTIQRNGKGYDRNKLYSDLYEIWRRYKLVFFDTSNKCYWASFSDEKQYASTSYEYIARDGEDD